MNSKDTDLESILRPRKYQEEILKKAQTGNVIAALETGSGKTYISVLLIKWMAICRTSIGRPTVFVVPKVALVDQQADFIAEQTPLRVKKLLGGSEMSMTDRYAWTEAFQSNDVLVCTGEGIFTN